MQLQVTIDKQDTPEILRTISRKSSGYIAVTDALTNELEEVRIPIDAVTALNLKAIQNGSGVMGETKIVNSALYNLARVPRRARTKPPEEYVETIKVTVGALLWALSKAYGREPEDVVKWAVGTLAWRVGNDLPRFWTTA